MRLPRGWAGHDPGSFPPASRHQPSAGPGGLPGQRGRKRRLERLPAAGLHQPRALRPGGEAPDGGGHVHRQRGHLHQRECSHPVPVAASPGDEDHQAPGAAAAVRGAGSSQAVLRIQEAGVRGGGSRGRACAQRWRGSLPPDLGVRRLAERLARGILQDHIRGERTNQVKKKKNVFALFFQSFYLCFPFPFLSSFHLSVTFMA